MARSWVAVLGCCAGAVLIGRAWWIDRPALSAPVVRVAASSLLERPLDTMLVLPATARYIVVLDFAIPPGDARRPLLKPPAFVDVDFAIADQRVSTSGSSSVGTYSSGSAGLYWGPLTGSRADTLRLQARALPALAAWPAQAPTLEVRRDFLDASNARLNRVLLALAGSVLVAASAFAYWRRRRP